MRCSVSVVIQRLGQSSTCKVSQSSYFISLTKIERMSGKETFKKIEIQHFLKVFLCDIISMFYKRNITFQKPYAMNYYQDVEPLPKRWTSTKQLGPALACFMVKIKFQFIHGSSRETNMKIEKRRNALNSKSFSKLKCSNL